MEFTEDVNYPLEAKTPEPQRFNAHTLGCYPTVAENAHVSVVAGANTPGSDRTRHAVEHVDAEEDNSNNQARFGCRLNAQIEREGLFLGQHPCTPPTISRHNWLQLHLHEDAMAASAGARVCEGFYPLSPASQTPPPQGQPRPHFYDGTSELRGGRSVSCPSADRSVAPARYSVECNRMGGGRGGSAGRHTTVLGGAGVNGSGLHDTPHARLSCRGTPNGLRSGVMLTVRPTVLLHTAVTPPVRRPESRGFNANGFELHHAGRLSNVIYADEDRHHALDDDDTQPILTQAYVESRRSAALANVRGSIGGAVPHLTRFSCGSHGSSSCSPGAISACMGRPTTLGCPDFDLSAYRQWEGDDLDEGTVPYQNNNNNNNISANPTDFDDDDEPWVGGSTQVWYSSTDLNGPAVAARHSSGDTQNEERVRQGSVLGRGSTNLHEIAPSPEATWRPVAFGEVGSHSDVHRYSTRAALFRDAGGNEESAEGSASAGKQNSVTSAVPSASLTGLEDAPRKSYVRSADASPTRAGADAHAAAGTGCDAPQTAEDAHVAAQYTAAASQPHSAQTKNADTQLTRAAAEKESIESLASLHAVQQQPHHDLDSSDWLHQRAVAQAAGLIDGDATPQGRSLAPQGLPATASAADAVAAQLARLSLQASPTQKRLAFEEEEDDRLEDGSSGSGERSEGHRRPTSSAAMRGAMVAGRAGLNAGCSGSEANVGAAQRWAGSSRGGGGGGSLTGLQLLRSRKRCLEEMQATDLEVESSSAKGTHEIPTLGGGSLGGACGLNSFTVASAVPAHEELKRQKREKQRYQRQQHLLPGEGSGDDLIPAPMRAGAAPSVYSSVATHPLSYNNNSGFSQNASQPPQPVESANWSQLSSISYVSPASQSVSNGFIAALSHVSATQRDTCVAVGAGGAACASAFGSPVLSTLPTNVAQRYPHNKQ